MNSAAAQQEAQPIVVPVPEPLAELAGLSMMRLTALVVPLERHW